MIDSPFNVFYEGFGWEDPSWNIDAKNCTEIDEIEIMEAQLEQESEQARITDEYFSENKTNNIKKKEMPVDYPYPPQISISMYFEESGLRDSGRFIQWTYDARKEIERKYKEAEIMSRLPVYGETEEFLFFYCSIDRQKEIMADLYKLFLSEKAMQKAALSPIEASDRVVGPWIKCEYTKNKSLEKRK